MSRSEILNNIYQQVSDLILARQHPVTGLFPASSSINNHGDYTDAWVRDNVYTIMAVWASAIAMKKAGRAVEADRLEQSSIKMMRGLLQSMMRQANKVESFKHSHSPSQSLHAKYNTITGLEVVADDAWGHLQIDATSLYLLMLAQMTKGGLRIIATQGEVDFIQNLIYYISYAHSIKDFGIWERGNKINNGKPEVNASSVGMAKAALQALDRLNLFCQQDAANACVHSIPDSIARCRSTLRALLPKESRSKEVDSALLSIIGFPAFAVSDPSLIDKTEKEICSKLEGEYGFKRFLLDGHQTEIEDTSRMHYQHSELINFANIESEWPLFYCYMYINSLFQGDSAKAKKYRQKLDKVAIKKHGYSMLPELYYVEKKFIESEKCQPGSQPRVANDNLPLIWAQSLFYVGQLLEEGFIECQDLDPVNLRQSQTRDAKPSVALVILAQDEQVKKLLANAGVISETIAEIAPLKVCSASQLISVYADVGSNEQLGLTGRPKRRLHSLASSHPYNINGQKLLCLSWLQDQAGDYSRLDGRLLCEIIHSEITYIKDHWFYAEPAVVTLLIDHRICQLSGSEQLIKMIKDFQHRNISEKISHATSDLAFVAGRITHITHNAKSFNPLQLNKRAAQLNRYGRFTGAASEHVHCLLSQASVGDKLHALEQFRIHYDDCAQLQFEHTQLSYKRFLLLVAERASIAQQWLLVRKCYAIVAITSEDLHSAVAEILLCRISIVIGQDEQQQILINKLVSNDQVHQLIEQASTDEIEQVLLQEVLLAVGLLVRNHRNYFEGVKTIHLHHLILWGNNEPHKFDGQIIVEQAMRSPNELYQQIKAIFKAQYQLMDKDCKIALNHSSFQAQQNFMTTNWENWRLQRGLMIRLDEPFMVTIWQSLRHFPALVFGDRANAINTLDCNQVLQSMTPQEESFRLLLESLLSNLYPASYKGLIIECLEALCLLCQAQPNVRFAEPVILGQVIEQAQQDYQQQNKRKEDFSALSSNQIAGFLTAALMQQSVDSITS
ncbi:glycoside hydrolase family 15 protein [Paraferrimonas sp. SM1919]|uniref:glycoside hydrolase family 15 protein n=1 Tax=Paraferrimonas sp. SM1919 TaxID=2662263 RepID=UPI0013D54246|nr:glycoside hydrolase family 15 protein [Paraferrimonas sp. SM1919]